MYTEAWKVELKSRSCTRSRTRTHILSPYINGGKKHDKKAILHDIQWIKFTFNSPSCTCLSLTRLSNPRAGFEIKAFRLKLPLWKGRRSSIIDLWYSLPIPFRGNNLVRSFITYHNLNICWAACMKLPNFLGRSGPGLAHFLRMHLYLFHWICWP